MKHLNLQTESSLTILSGPSRIVLEASYNLRNSLIVCLYDIISGEEVKHVKHSIVGTIHTPDHPIGGDFSTASLKFLIKQV